MGFQDAEVTARSMATAVAIGWIWAASPISAAELDWDPAHTHVFVVGILEWERPDLWAPFPEAMKDRRDEQLVRHFQNAGVPPGKIVYLADARATKQRIHRKFAELLDETNDGDLLVFYFAGHGYRDRETGQTWFANYDAGDKSKSGWNVRSVFATIEERFSGDRVLLMADCCHSGALYDEVRRRADADVAYAVLTSSYAHNTSTGAWTFTDGVLDALRGKPVIDYDGDAVIELNEAARYVKGEMAFVEGQMSMFTADDDFGAEAKLAAAAGPRLPQVDYHCEALSEGKWYKARVVAFDAARNAYQVHYLGYGDDSDERLPTDRVRPYKPREFAVGAKVECFWPDDKRWYPATVREHWYGLHRIHYDDYDATWDEWVGPGRVRPR